jgi:hypothetical protein
LQLNFKKNRFYINKKQIIILFYCALTHMWQTFQYSSDFCMVIFSSVQLFCFGPNFPFWCVCVCVCVFSIISSYYYAAVHPQSVNNAGKKPQLPASTNPCRPANATCAHVSSVPSRGLTKIPVLFQNERKKGMHQQQQAKRKHGVRHQHHQNHKEWAKSPNQKMKWNQKNTYGLPTTWPSPHTRQGGNSPTGSSDAPGVGASVSGGGAATGASVSGGGAATGASVSGITGRLAEGAEVGAMDPSDMVGTSDGASDPISDEASDGLSDGASDPGGKGRSGPSAIHSHSSSTNAGKNEHATADAAPDASTSACNSAHVGSDVNAAESKRRKAMSANGTVLSLRSATKR